MEQLFQLVNSNLVLILSLLIFIQLITILLLFSQRYSIKKLVARQKKLFRGNNNNNLEEVLEKCIEEVEGVCNAMDEVKKDTRDVKENLDNCLQKIGFLRFSAFENTGSDLSFSVAFLDNKDNGIIISSLYGREESRTYAKSVIGGKPQYHLSTEEKKALEIALTPSH